MTGIEREVLTTLMGGTREREGGGGRRENATILHHATRTTRQASTLRGTVFTLRRVDMATRVGVVLEGGEEEEGGTGDTNLQEDRVPTNVRHTHTSTHLHIHTPTHTSCAYTFITRTASGPVAYPSYPPPMSYYNSPIAGGSNMFFSPYSGPMFYNTPILPVDENTLQDYIKKQM